MSRATTPAGKILALALLFIGGVAHAQEAPLLHALFQDHVVLQRAARRIIAARQPTFAHVILLTNHHPFSYVREHRGLPPAGIVADYVQSVRYMDESIAGFFAELKAAGVLDNCIVVLFGDHDSSITGQLERELQAVPVRAMADTVPLIVTGLPEAPRRIAAVAGLQDAPVIVLEALGLPVPPTFTGNGLDGAGRTVAAMYGALEDTSQGLRPAPLRLEVGRALLGGRRIHPQELEQVAVRVCQLSRVHEAHVLRFGGRRPARSNAGGDHRIDGATGIGLGQFGGIGYGFDEFGFVHLLDDSLYGL